MTRMGTPRPGRASTVGKREPLPEPTIRQVGARWAARYTVPGSGARVAWFKSKTDTIAAMRRRA